MCATSYIHDNCLIKLGREKSAKKVQGAAPAWLRDVLHCAGMRYFCPSCNSSLEHTQGQPTTDQNVVITTLNEKIAAIDNKVDLLLSTLVESVQLSSEATVNTDATVPAKPLYSKIAAQAPTRELLKDVVTEVIQSRDHKVVQNTSVVLLGVPISKNDSHTVSEILRAIDCDCKIAKLHRLGKNTKTSARSTDQPNPAHQAPNTTPPNVDQQAQRSPPILVTFSTELDRFSVLRNANLSLQQLIIVTCSFANGSQKKN